MSHDSSSSSGNKSEAAKFFSFFPKSFHFFAEGDLKAGVDQGNKKQKIPSQIADGGRNITVPLLIRTSEISHPIGQAGLARNVRFTIHSKAVSGWDLESWSLWSRNKSRKCTLKNNLCTFGKQV